MSKFKNVSEEKVWIPLLETILEGSNLAMALAEGDDMKYCRTLAMVHDILIPLYVDTEVIDIKSFNRLFYVFVYVLETVYGDPLSNEKKSFSKLIDITDYWSSIKKHWNDDITKEIKKYKSDVQC